jgi:hypothetical protein
MRRIGEWHHGCFILDSSLAQIESTHVIEFRKISLPEEIEIVLQIDGKIFADFPGDLFDVEDWADLESYWMLEDGAIVSCSAFIHHVDSL